MVKKIFSIALVFLATAVFLPNHADALISFDSNLVLNPGAEMGLNSWDIQGSNFTWVAYGTSGGFPTAGSPGPVNRGDFFFAGGNNNYHSGARQLLDISTISSFVDTGVVSFDLGAFLGGYSSQDDNGFFSVSFLDNSSVPISSFAISPVIAPDRSSITGMIQKNIDGDVPIGTRIVQFDLQFDKYSGSYNDGYADNLSFVLSNNGESVVPEPATMVLFGAGITGLFFKRKRRA